MVSVVNKDTESKENTYLAVYRTKAAQHAPATKLTFYAGSGMKALKKLAKYCGVKSVEDFYSLALMEVLPGNKYRDVMEWNSETNAAKARAANTTADVVDLATFRENKTMGKGKGKKHVKLGWLTTKIGLTEEKRILSKMKLLQAKDFTPAQVAGMSDKEVRQAITTVGGDDVDEIRREAYYQRHYGYNSGMGMYGED